MGSSIDCFFSRGCERDPADLRAVLDDLMRENAEDIQTIQDRGTFSRHSGDWQSLDWEILDKDEPQVIYGEGPAGLSIQVCERIVEISSVERFPALWYEPLGISLALRRVLCSMARRLASSPEIVIATGGGWTDEAHDLAYDNSGSLEEIIASMHRVFSSPPARNWDELAKDWGFWYLGRLDAQD